MFKGILMLLCLASSAHAEGWLRWRGPDLTGISRETNWTAKWPRSGPDRVWRAQVGTGFSSVTVGAGRVYTMGNDKNRDTVFCLSESTGKTLWSHSYASPIAPRYYDGGPSATPTIDGDTVYSLGRQGDLFAFSAESGKILWQKNIAKEIGAEYPEWGYSSSPFVSGEMLVLNVGTAGVAVNRKTGKLIWQNGKKTSGYSTPIPFTHRGTDCFALFGAKAMYALEVKSGRIVWNHPWKTSWDINVAEPIIHQGRMFISSGYDRGGALLNITASKPEVIWENRNMRNHFNSCVLIDGHLYGFDGNSHRGRAYLACIDFETGEKKWSDARYGYGSISAADGKLIVLGARGQLAVAEASPESFNPISQAQVLGGLCWTPPVLANSHLYCRNSRGDLVRLDVGDR
jgi:outer membrane protein assembly factor BamB